MTAAAELPAGFQPVTISVGAAGIVTGIFNPESYTISKTSTWNVKPVLGADAVRPEYGGGQPRTMSVKFLLDASLAGPAGTIKPQVLILSQATEIPVGLPPGGPSSVPGDVVFTWGTESFTGVCTSLTITYTMFQANGTPIRADVDLALTEVPIPALGQNPTTRALPGLRTHYVTAGESLQSIAEQAYGDPAKWRAIAQANEIDDPFRLRGGVPLVLPDLRRTLT